MKRVVYAIMAASSAAAFGLAAVEAPDGRSMLVQGASAVVAHGRRGVAATVGLRAADGRDMGEVRVIVLGCDNTRPRLVETNGAAPAPWSPGGPAAIDLLAESICNEVSELR